MFLPEPRVRIWLYTRPADMRKSYQGLSTLVRNQLDEDPLSGQLFVSINRRQTQMKVLYFESSGYCIWAKKLEQGQFNFRPTSCGKSLLDWAELKLFYSQILKYKSADNISVIVMIPPRELARSSIIQPHEQPSPLQ